MAWDFFYHSVKRSDTAFYLDAMELRLNLWRIKKQAHVDDKLTLIEVSRFCATFTKQYRLLWYVVIV